jgi:hypothetical protein
MIYRFKDKHELQTIVSICGGIFLVLVSRPLPQCNGVTDDLCDSVKMLMPCVYSKADVYSISVLWLPGFEINFGVRKK